MNRYPADERRISDVERGRCFRATVPCELGSTPVVGESILFVHALAQPSREPSYVLGGDSVRVVLTNVTELGTTDPTTGHPLVELTWEPLGQPTPVVVAPRRPARPRPPRAGV